MKLRIVLWLVPATLLLVCGAKANDKNAGTKSKDPDFGALERIVAFPERVRLEGKDARQQLLITGQSSTREKRDVTRSARYTSRNSEIAVVSEAGIVAPTGSGQTEIIVRIVDKEIPVPVSVQSGERYLPLRFEDDIVPIITKRGCNSGGCHGKATGQGGFKLSLFGFEPGGDFEAILAGGRGRRVFPAAAGNSLLLRKPTAAIAHGGGKKLSTHDADYARLERWIEEGCPWGTKDAARLTSIDIEPEFRSLDKQQQQQCVVTAVFENGRRVDVTPLAEYRTNAPAVATVDEHGLISTRERIGETAVVATYRGHTTVARVMVPYRGDAGRRREFAINNFIDDHVAEKLDRLGVPAATVVGDAEFFRRASLQISGRLPTADRARAFVASSDPKKREELVDELLYSAGYADVFAQKWCDLLRNRRRAQSPRLAGTIGFHRWIRNAIATGMPYDRFVEAVITATGSPNENPPAQWYAEVRYIDRCVDDSAQVFLGLSIGCARCHHHPFESFSQEDWYGLAAFFSRVDRKGGVGIAERRANEAILVKRSGDVKHPVTGQVVPPHGLGAAPVQVPPFEDPRRYLVEWMTDPANPYFARAFVNRMWGHFFGRGLVDPIDDMRETNPATNEPLLDALAQEFVRSNYDMRRVVELICKSTTYQLSSTNGEAFLAETQNHSRFYPQRLIAEVLLDAIDQVTESSTRYSGLPAGTLAMQLPDEDFSNTFLRKFGRPLRESACECERVAAPSLSQSLIMMNDSFVLNKINAKSGFVARLAKDPRPHAEKIRDLFWTTLTRDPTDDELEMAVKYCSSGEDPADRAYGNLLWALINTKEFLFVF